MSQHQPIVLCMLGAEGVFNKAHAVAMAQGVSMEAGFAKLTRADVMQAAMNAMPPRAREAFEMGQRTVAKRRASQTMRQDQPLQIVAMTSAPRSSALSDADTHRARSLLAKAAEPLTREQLEICRMMSVTPEAFKEERDRALLDALPGNKNSLTQEERDVCRVTGMSESDFAAAKARG